MAQNILLATVLGASLLHSGILQRFSQDQRFLHDRNQDWRAAVQHIESSQASDDLPVLVRSGFLEADRLPSDSSDLLRRYCLAPINSLYRLTTDQRELIPLTTTRAGRLNDSTVRTIVRQRGAWFVINGSQRAHAHFERELNAKLAEQNIRVQLQQSRTFGELLVIECQVLDSSPHVR